MGDRFHRPRMDAVCFCSVLAERSRNASDALKGLCSRTVAVIECGKVESRGKRETFSVRIVTRKFIQGVSPFWKAIACIYNSCLAGADPTEINRQSGEQGNVKIGFTVTTGGAEVSSKIEVADAAVWL